LFGFLDRLFVGALLDGKHGFEGRPFALREEAEGGVAPTGLRLMNGLQRQPWFVGDDPSTG
jgi:hypothetical protein